MKKTRNEREEIRQLNNSRKRGEVINMHSYEQSLEKRLQILSEQEDYLSKYYLGQLYKNRGDIERAMRLYMDSLKGSQAALKDFREFRNRYPKEYGVIMKKGKN